LFNPGDVVVIDFPGVTGVKRRPTVVLSSAVYTLRVLMCRRVDHEPNHRVWSNRLSVAGLGAGWFAGSPVFRVFSYAASSTNPIRVGHLSDRLAGCLRLCQCSACTLGGPEATDSQTP
jgi:mRNA interferase MazF